MSERRWVRRSAPFTTKFTSIFMSGAVALVALTGLAGCTNKSSTTTSRDATSRDALVIDFVARVGADLYSCAADGPVAAFGETTIAPGGLRLFVHDVEFTLANGSVESGKLINDAFWQTDDVALLDFEDGTARCRGGSGETNTKILVERPSGAVTAVAFSIGVPFAQNHADPAKASGPLTYTAMHWSWKAGYKFLRLDGKTADGAGYELHLGSTGCKGSIGDVESCARGNRPRVVIGDFDRHNGRIVLDVAQLVSAAATETGDSNFGCLSEMTQAGCVPVFRQLGLDFETGEASGEQLVFSTE